MPVSILLFPYRRSHSGGDLDADLHLLPREGDPDVRHRRDPVFHQHLAARWAAGLGGPRLFAPCPHLQPIEMLPVDYAAHRGHLSGHRREIRE